MVRVQLLKDPNQISQLFNCVWFASPRWISRRWCESWLERFTQKTEKKLSLKSIASFWIIKAVKRASQKVHSSRCWSSFPHISLVLWRLFYNLKTKETNHSSLATGKEETRRERIGASKVQLIHKKKSAFPLLAGSEKRFSLEILIVLKFSSSLKSGELEDFMNEMKMYVRRPKFSWKRGIHSWTWRYQADWIRLLSFLFSVWVSCGKYMCCAGSRIKMWEIHWGKFRPIKKSIQHAPDSSIHGAFTVVLVVVYVVQQPIFSSTL